MTRKALYLFLFLVTIAAFGPGANATQTETHGIYAVPAPGKIVIDGKLDDWDLSGQVLMCYDIEKMLNTNSARVAIMYDALNLYVAIQWKDLTPMSNAHDPHYQADRGWAGDAVQMRIKTDEITHVTAWYDAPHKEPAIQIQRGVGLTKPFGGDTKTLFATKGWEMQEGVAMAFKKDKDGKGYVQEIRLPWKLVTKDKQYHAGDRLHIGFEVLWGDGGDKATSRYADNLTLGTTTREFFFYSIKSWGPVYLSPKGHLQLPKPTYLAKASDEAQGPVTITYKLPRDAQVTLVIDTPAGKRIRNLIADQSRTKGENTEYWDGLDDAGKPVPAGQYRFKGIYHDPIHTKYVMSFANPGNPTWSTSDGRGAFYGDHTAPRSAAAAGDYVALACPMGEAGKPLIGLDLTGQKLWEQANRNAFSGYIQSLATDGKCLYVAAEDTRSFIYRLDVATGAYAPWNKTIHKADGQSYRVLDLPVGDIEGDGKRVNNFSVPPTDPKHPGPNLIAIAYHDGLLAVCLRRENKLLLLDGDTGQTKATISVKQPRAVTFAKQGGWIVLSANQLVHVDRSGHVKAFTSKPYPDGFGLATDTAGDIYLSVRGETQDVQVFSPQGQPVRQIGKPGGRPLNGRYDPQGMRNPAGIAIDSKGRLWVTEQTDNPKRTSVWDTHAGKLLKDMPGTTGYASAGAINPYDPTMAFADNTVYKIDLSTGKWHPVYSLGGDGQTADWFPSRVNSHVRVMRHAGKTYVFSTSNGRDAYGVRCMMFDGKYWRSVASIGVVNKYLERSHTLFKGKYGQGYVWADLNGDGLVQKREVQVAPLTIDGKTVGLTNPYWGQLPDADGTVPLLTRDKNIIVKYRILGYTHDGTPHYDITKPQLIHLSQPFNHTFRGMMMGGPDGRIYVNASPLNVISTDGSNLFSYPSNYVSVGGSHRAPAAQSGLLIGPSSILGIASYGPKIGDIFYLNGNLGENYLFTSDGLWITSLFHDLRGGYTTPLDAKRGMSMDNTTAGGESFGGNFIRAESGPNKGKTYLTLGSTGARVVQITGLDSIRRFHGTFGYSPKEHALVLKTMRANPNVPQTPKSTVIAKATTNLIIDGRENDWPKLSQKDDQVLTISRGPQHVYAHVAIKYNQKNLYLAYRVYSKADHMRNAGPDWRFIFKTGDLVDLMIGPSKQHQLRGDMRLAMTVLKGKPLAVLYQPEDPSAPKDMQCTFESPWRSITFDRVVKASQVKMATGKLADGYFIEAAVPWKMLGIMPRSGLELKGDVGVLFADQGGSKTVSRQYWSNKDTGLVNDVPGEAMLTPDRWGTFKLQ